MKHSKIDFKDVQGLVRYGYGRLPESCFLLLEIISPRAARDWLKTLDVADAEELSTPPDFALQVAFTHSGLRKIGLSSEIADQFSQEFKTGIYEESRSKRLGDVGENAPREWQWGGDSDNTPHLMLMLYSVKGGLEARKNATVDGLSSAGLALRGCLTSADFGGVEPFGFKDGISQPTVDWDGKRKLDGRDELEYGNLVALGEFLLGHRNEYGKYTDRPLLDLANDPRGILAEAEDKPGKKDFAFNGTYLVFRQLQQHVGRFWKFLDDQVGGDPSERQRLAELMVGRKVGGEALAVKSSSPIPGVDSDQRDANQFTFSSDPDGTCCPFGAHVRRANPRNADLPDGTRGLLSKLIRTLGFGGKGFRGDLISSVRFHRILRRGVEYGEPLRVNNAIKNGGNEIGERGLHFICLNANISRQFEFIQGAWLSSTKFDGMTEESDPIIGNREAVSECPFTNSFSIPQEAGLRRRISGIPAFITVRGGSYFFLPGIRALRYLSSLETD